jgi:tetratricopeptide (TPR) repeat protein
MEKNKKVAHRAVNSNNFLLVTSFALAGGLLIFILLFLYASTKNSLLQKQIGLLELNLSSVSLDSQKNIERMKEEKGQWENGVLDYIQWKYILQDQVALSGQKIYGQISKLKSSGADKSLLSLLYYNLGLSHTLAIDFASAIDAFEEAGRLDPENSFIFYNLGLLYSTYAGNSKRALENYRKYLALSPSGSKADLVTERVAELEGPR